jgi:tetratricopeptide (TPR) repeat protein
MERSKGTEGGRKVLSADNVHDPASRTFASLLSWHMDNGTRPNGSARRWGAEELSETYGVSSRSVRNWRNGTYLPDIETIERLLFGANPVHASARIEMRAAWADAKQHPSHGPSASSPSNSTDLILPPARCFGREREAEALIAALVAPGTASLLVLGPPGIGKTTLTRRVATDESVVARFLSRRYFVPLETAADAATMRTTISRSIGLRAVSSFPATLAALSEQPSLIVLDNLETPWEQDQLAIENLLLTLTETPNISILASLRGTVAPTNPRWTVRPTRLPVLSEEDSRRLFLELAPEAETDSTHLRHFITALSGVPLAVELVALRAAGDTNLAELWVEWQRCSTTLTEHPDLHPARLTSLRVSLDLSWNSPRLRQPGRRLFRVLGALPAGIADADRITLFGNDAAEAARQLCAVGLAFRRHGRIDLLAPVREYARDTHPPETEEATLWCRHYLRMTDDIAERVLRAVTSDELDRLAPEVANIESASRTIHSAQLLLESVYGLGWDGRKLPGHQWLDRLSDFVGSFEGGGPFNDRQGQAVSEFFRGSVAIELSRYDTARQAFQLAIDHFVWLESEYGQARAIERIGDVDIRCSDYHAATAAYGQALTLYRRCGDLLGQAGCHRSLGEVALQSSKHKVARKAFEQGQKLFSKVGDLNGQGSCLIRLGRLAKKLGNLGTAKARFRDALALFSSLRAFRDIAESNEELARIAVGTERYAHVQAARSMWNAVGDVDRVKRLDQEFGRTS